MESLNTIIKKALTFGLACVCAGSALIDTAAADDKNTLASYTLKALGNDKQIKLSEFRGDIVVVNFWASWCAPCRKELPVMDRWNTAWSGQGARVVAISIDKSKKNAQRFVEQVDLSLDVYHDGPSGLAKTLDLPSLPCTFLLDREGNVVSVVSSSSMKELDALQQKVEFLMTSTRKPSVQKAGAMPPAIPAGEPSNDGGKR